MIENPMYLADPPEPEPMYELIGYPRVESDYSDEWESCVVCVVRRHDGVIGDVWLVAGVPAHLQGSSAAARTQRGYRRVRTFGNHPSMWCPSCFDAEHAEEIMAACSTAALAAHADFRETTISKRMRAREE